MRLISSAMNRIAYGGSRMPAAERARNQFLRPPLSFVFHQAHRGNNRDVANGSWRTSMRGFASYLVAGVLVVFAMDFIAPPAGLGLALGAWPAVDQNTVV